VKYTISSYKEDILIEHALRCCPDETGALIAFAISVAVLTPTSNAVMVEIENDHHAPWLHSGYTSPRNNKAQPERLG
jgi:hypothetical protein